MFHQNGFGRMLFVSCLAFLCVLSNALAADLTITGLEVTQAIQYFDNAASPDNSLPLIRGRRTIVRMYIGGTDLPIAGVDGSLRVFVNGVEMAGSPFSPLNGPITAPLTPDREETDHTLNFKFVAPKSGISIGTVDVDLIAEVNPGKTVVESNYDNNTLMLDDLQFECRRSPSIAYVPINYTFAEPNPANTGLPSAFLMSPGIGDDFIWHAYPIPEPPNYYRSAQPAIALATDIESSLTALQASLTTTRTLTVPLPDFLYGWLPGNPYSMNGSSYCIGCSTVAFGNTQNAAMSPFAGGGCNGDKFQRTMAHEITHLMGAVHNGRTLNPEVGFDAGWPFFEVSDDDCDPPGSPQQGTKCRELNDVMVAALCTGNAWVDPLQYQFLSDHDLLQSLCPGTFFEPLDPREYFIINGGFLRLGCEVIDCCPGCPGPEFIYPIYELMGPQKLTASNPAGRQRIELRNVQGQVLQGVNFDVSFESADAEGPSNLASFSLILPAGPTVSSQVASAVLLSDGKEVYRIQRSPHGPVVRIDRICRGEKCTPAKGGRLTGSVEIQWEGSDADGDALLYSLQYSPDGGETFVALAVNLRESSFRFDTSQIAGTTGSNGILRLIATDGLNTSTDEIAVSVPDLKPPTVLITEPASPDPLSIRAGSPLILGGHGYDPEDGFLPEESLQWHSSLDGLLGSGRLLQATGLSPGQHTVSLVGVDSDGTTVERRIIVNVLQANVPPDCGAATPSLAELWPPNHKFVRVSVQGVTDADGGPVAITITGIHQDEPLKGGGSGNDCPDASVIGAGEARLRAERMGQGDGRVYHVSFTATDEGGAACSGELAVCVPHDRRRGHTCGDQGALVDSAGACSGRSRSQRLRAK